MDEFPVYPVTLAELEDRTGLRYPAALHDVKEAISMARAAGERRPLDTISDIRW